MRLILKAILALLSCFGYIVPSGNYLPTYSHLIYQFRIPAWRSFEHRYTRLLISHPRPL